MRFGLVLCLILMGCGKQAQVATVAQPPVPEQKNPAHRFEITSYIPKDVAFDTVTGTYCRTWEAANYPGMPTCMDLSRSLLAHTENVEGLPPGAVVIPISNGPPPGSIIGPLKPTP